MTSIQVRDTFTHFLADNLTGINVHQCRRDINNPNQDDLEMNTVNLSFINTDFDRHINVQHVVIDIIHDDERTAFDWTQQVWTLLSKAFMTPVFDYTNPSSPVQQNSNIFWTTSAKFRPVKGIGFYYHFTCFMKLSFSNF